MAKQPGTQKQQLGSQTQASLRRSDFVSFGFARLRHDVLTYT
jgi:hypothetical protein